MNSRQKSGSFFRTMVLMSGSLTIGCGGLAEDNDPHDSGASGGNDTGGSATTGGVAGIGGGATGGASGGGINIGSGGLSGGAASGGSTGGADMGGAFPTDCPTEQLKCTSNLEYNCDSGSLRRLPNDCVCDGSLPADPSDCEEGEQFACLGASTDASGNPLASTIPYECQCVPGTANDGCRNLCRGHSQVEANYFSCSEPEELDLDAVLCGCAVLTLK